MHQFGQHRQRHIGVDGEGCLADPFVGMGPDGSRSHQHPARSVGSEQQETVALAVAPGPSRAGQVHSTTDGVDPPLVGDDVVDADGGDGRFGVHGAGNGTVVSDHPLPEHVGCHHLGLVVRPVCVGHDGGDVPGCPDMLQTLHPAPLIDR